MIEFIRDNFILIAGVVTAIKWVYEYSQKLRWEKSKFLLDMIGEFNEIESTGFCQKALDWNAFHYKFDGEEFFIDDQILYEALQTHDKKNSFTKLEMKIRENFDDYFDGLTEFLILSKCGLILEKDFREFMSYWIEIMNRTRKSKNELLASQIEAYMLFYGFGKLHDFISKKRVF